MNVIKNIAKVIAVVMGFSTFGCSNFEAGEPDLDPDPLQKGPGILTGRSGSWTIMRR